MNGGTGQIGLLEADNCIFPAISGVVGMCMHQCPTHAVGFAGGWCFGQPPGGLQKASSRPAIGIQLTPSIPHGKLEKSGKSEIVQPTVHWLP